MDAAVAPDRKSGAFKKQLGPLGSDNFFSEMRTFYLNLFYLNILNLVYNNLLNSPWSSTKNFRFRKFWRSDLDQNSLRITNPGSDLTGDQ